ncbi:unnamed protein product, partial [Cuscuta campestris]
AERHGTQEILFHYSFAASDFHRKLRGAGRS